MLPAKQQIQEALKNDLTRFQFEGREIMLDPRAGIFITMVSLPDSYDCCWQQGPWRVPAALTGTVQAACLEHPGLILCCCVPLPAEPWLRWPY